MQKDTLYIVRGKTTTQAYHYFTHNNDDDEGERIAYTFPWRINDNVRHMYTLSHEERLLALKEAIEFGRLNPNRGYIHNEE